MIDREKVIKDLRDIAGFITGRIGIEQARNFLRTIDDAIAMLKEQKDLGTELTNAVELIHKKNERIEKLLEEQEEQEPLAVYEGKVNKCVCGNEINRYWHPEYCGFCGKKLLWY